MINKDLIEFYNNLFDLRQRNEIRFPAKVSFSIIRNLKILFPIVESFDIARTTILQTYGTLADDRPGYYKIESEQSKQALKELEDLENTEVNIQIQKIGVQDIESLELSIQDMEALYPMLEEE